MKDIDWTSIAEPIARELLGEPTRAFSSKHELRWGRKGSFKLRTDTGAWHDFESGTGGGVLDLVMREMNTDKAGAIAWLREHEYLPAAPNTPQTALRVRSQASAPPAGRSANSDSPSATHADDEGYESGRPKISLADVCKGWEQIPTDQSHPARRWAALRDLWQPGEPFPAGLAWLPAGSPWFRGRHEGAGAIVFKLAPIDAWQAAYPKTPGPIAVQLVNIDAEGRPVLDRPEAEDGLSKRTYGVASGHVLLIGDGDVLHVCEGLADGLRIRRYEGGTVAIVCGTAGMRQCATWQSIELYRHVRLWPDADKGGREAAQHAGQLLANREIAVAIMRLPDGMDPAEAPLVPRSANTANTPRRQETPTPPVDVAGDVDGDSDVAIVAAFDDLTDHYTRKAVL